MRRWHTHYTHYITVYRPFTDTRSSTRAFQQQRQLREPGNSLYNLWPTTWCTKVCVAYLKQKTNTWYTYDIRHCILIALLSRDASTEERYKITSQRKKMQKQQRETHSLWMEKLYKLSLANHVGCHTVCHIVTVYSHSYAMMSSGCLMILTSGDELMPYLHTFLTCVSQDV